MPPWRAVGRHSAGDTRCRRSDELSVLLPRRRFVEDALDRRSATGVPAGSARIPLRIDPRRRKLLNCAGHDRRLSRVTGRRSADNPMSQP